jgi:hypothetical protein
MQALANLNSKVLFSFKKFGGKNATSYFDGTAPNLQICKLQANML